MLAVAAGAEYHGTRGGDVGLEPGVEGGTSGGERGQVKIQDSRFNIQVDRRDLVNVPDKDVAVVPHRDQLPIIRGDADLLDLCRVPHPRG